MVAGLGSRSSLSRVRADAREGRGSAHDEGGEGDDVPAAAASMPPVPDEIVLSKPRVFQCCAFRSRPSRLCQCARQQRLQHVTR